MLRVLGQLQDEVSGVPNEAATGLEESHQIRSISPAAMEVSTSSLIERKAHSHRGLCLSSKRGAATVLLPRCYQNTAHQDDLGRHPVIPDRFGLVRLGLLGCPEYVARGNS